jgi:hypothetical protein
MERMRAAILLALLACCGGCTGCNGEDPKPDKQPETDPPATVAWKQFNYGGVRMALPETFTKKLQRPEGTKQILFFGPWDKGFQPVVSVLWAESEMNVERWADIRRGKYDHPESPGKVIEKRWTSIGGCRAFMMVYEQTAPDPKRDNQIRRFMTIDWYFQTRGHVGFLRGVSAQEEFPFKYRPLFEKIAAQVRFTEPK